MGPEGEASMGETKHVQTEFADEEYEEFQVLANERGLSLKDALKEAAEQWVAEQRRVDPDDPLFAILDEVERDGWSAGSKTDARDEDDLLDDWSGEDADVRLADDPRTGR